MVSVMDRICQYSTIIFAGNVSILLLVSVSTDYWQYRGVSREHLLRHLPPQNGTEVSWLRHTNTCILLRHKWYNRTHPHLRIAREHLDVDTYYQPPVLLNKSFFFNVTVQSKTDTDLNITTLVNVSRRQPYEDVLVLYTEYGNLMRNCDDLGGE